MKNSIIRGCPSPEWPASGPTCTSKLFSAARSAAIVFRDVDVVELARIENGLDAGDRVLFFDVRVKGVVHRAEVRVIHPLHVAGGLLHGVQEMAFKAVQSFDGTLHAGGLGDR